MKKLVALSLALSVFASNAEAVQNQVYVGADYVYTMNGIDKGEGPHYKQFNPEIDYATDYADDYSSPSLNIGYNFNESLGIEAFYQTSNTQKDKYFGVWNSLDSLASETSFQAYGADLMAYIEGTDKVDWLLSAGVAQYQYETKYKYQYLGRVNKLTVDDDGLGVRLGAGIQINFDRYVSLRAMYRYIFMDLDGIKHSQELLVGVRIGFYPFY